MNVKDSIKKVGAVAGSALMVGMTLGSASLADFPQPFVEDDGTVASQIVVGQNAMTADVVGAINVAAALGQNAVQTETQTETVSVSGAGDYGWSVNGGETLDTVNDQLYFGQNIDEVRTTLTEDHLEMLETVDFTDDAGDSQEVEFFLYPGSNAIDFDNPGDADDEDPFLHVVNPEPSTVDNGLYKLQANFEDGLEFGLGDSTADDNRNDDVLGEEVELFGTEFTIGEDSFSGDNTGELILFGSTQTVSLADGESGTVTVNDNEHTINVHAVNDNGVVYSVDGQSREQDDEGSEFTIEGQTVRIDNVINTVDDTGSADFEIGSQELVISDGDTIEDEDGDDIDGTYADLSGENVGSDTDTDDDVTVNSIEIGFGAPDSDEEYVRGGESFTNPVFQSLEFQFGGLNPDAGEGAGDNVAEIEFGTDGDDTVTASFADGEDDATVEFMYDSTLGTDGTGEDLEDSDEDTIHVTEGVAVEEDEYFSSDAGDFAHMWEVTSVDVDETDTNIAADDEAQVELRDVVTGATVEVDLDAHADDGTFDGDNDEYYRGEEVMDGQTYHVAVDDDGEDVYFGWGTGSDFLGSTTADGAVDPGDEISVYTAVDTDSGAAIAFTEAYDFTSHPLGAQDVTSGDVVYELPSTESTDQQTLTASHTAAGGGNPGTVTIGSQTITADGAADTDSTVTVTVGQVDYQVTYDTTESGTPSDFDTFEITDIQPDDTGAPASLVIQPEDDDDNEEAYLFEPGNDDGDDEVTAGGTNTNIFYTGGTYSGMTVQLESDDDVEVSYNEYGTHTMQDTDEQGSFTLHIPDGQSVAGAAFTGPEGDLEMGGGGTQSATVEYETVTGMGMLPDMAMLDTQVSDSVKQSQHLILVGGPAVNTLVSDLASNGDTWTQQNWANQHDNEALLQHVENAFASGQHALIVAGHSSGDTRAAARYISNYADHEQALSQAGNQLVLTEADYPAN